MVKIAIIHNIVTPYRLELFERLSKHNYIDELDVFYCLEKYKDRNWELSSGTQYSSKILSGYTFRFPIIKLPCSINPSIFTEIRKNRYDVVIVCGFTDITTQLAYIRCKMESIPIILWSELVSFLFKFNSLYTPIIKFFINQSDALIVPSTKSKSYHMTMGAPDYATFISPNTINGDLYNNKAQKYKEVQNTVKEDFGIHTKKNILFVGRFIKRKGVENLIHAFKKLKYEDMDVGLILLGDGEEKRCLYRLCIDEGTKDVYFKGFVSDEDKIKYYSISDILVLPSFWDIHPLVLPEAMACSLPIITTNKIASAKDIIINGENGYILNTNNIDELYFAIRNIILKKDSKILGNRSLKIFKEKCSLDIAVEGFIDAIKYVLERK